MKNPFSELGLNPEILRNLTDDQIASLVKSQYRALQVIYHPDSRSGAGSEEVSKKLNEAYSLIEDSKSANFLLCKEAFLKKVKRVDKQRELEVSVQNAMLEKDKALLSVVNYFTQIGDQNNVFDIAPCTFKLLDYVDYANISDFRMAHSFQEERNRLFYELGVSSNGVITKRKEGSSLVLPNKKLIGAVPEEIVKDYGGTKGILRLVQDFQTPDDIRARDLQGKIFPYVVSSSRSHGYANKDVSYASRKITPENFRVLLPLISPVANRGGLLFSINREDDMSFFELDGLIVDIKKSNNEGVRK